jgi:predicted RNase H-like HicB family nuclease
MTVEDYMKPPYRMRVDEDPDDGGYVISFPDLPGCLTCADTLDEIEEMADDAKRCWFEAAIECGYRIAMPSDKR